MRKFTFTTVACVSMFTGVASTSAQDLVPRNKEGETRLAEVKAAAAKGAAGLDDLMKRARDPDPAVRYAMIDAVANIGATAVPQLVEMLQKGDLFPSGSQEERSPQWIALLILERMDQKTKTETVIPALVAAMQTKPSADDAWVNLLEGLGRMGPESVQAIAGQMQRGVGLPEIAAKIGEAARPAVPQILKAFPKMGYMDRWEACQALATVKPDIKDLPAILKLMQDDEYGMVQDIAIILDRMGPAVVPGVVAQMNDKSLDWYPRYGAGIALEMMGAKAKEALPALQTVFKDSQEDLDVRVAAARAIAQISNSDVSALYQQIPNLEQDIVRVTREKSAARRMDFMKREAARNTDEAYPSIEETLGRWNRLAQMVYRMASGVEVAQANADLKKAASESHNGAFMDVNLVRVFLLCHSKSDSPLAGKLAPETEAQMKAYFFGRLDNQDETMKQVKEQGQDTKVLTSASAFQLGLHANKPLNFTTRDYLTIAVLKDDPAYKDRKFVAGGTVAERYVAWSNYFNNFLKDWSLNGLWIELGSTSYEYHTYPSLINLADLAPDPEVRKRAKMYLDLCLIEAQQISIADLRAGSKSRAKKGGLGSNFNPYLHLIYGERGRPQSHAPIAASNYQAPDAAILLHKLGPTVATYEIINRQAGEITQVARSHTERGFKVDSKMRNYAWCTPEYIMGATQFDPNLIYTNGCAGRWSGVMFRNRAAISLPPYCGERWNAQSKDVLIAQRVFGSYYTGYSRIDFTSGFDKVERDGWLFLDNGEAYAAIKIVTGSYAWTDPVKGSIQLTDQMSPIIVQTGRAADYKTFAGFQDAIVKAPLKLNFDDAKNLTSVAYTGPNSATVEFFTGYKPWTLPTVDGKPIDLVLTNNYSSPFIQSVKGSELVTVRYGDRTWSYDFGKNAVVAQK